MTGTSKLRCAIYTRKSTEEGLEQEFNSLDAQRDAAEAYIASQAHEGWSALPERYDDGGFTGGNMERPALKRLLEDIEAGGIDCVVVYKVDRLSRSLLDFARIMQTFEAHGVTFAAVTQQFNTTHSMGRLTLNILLSFAQFERELISERTRDKIAATRRKGQWSGGMPLLGYDVEHAPGGTKLVVNEEEAERVRSIYELYLERRSLVEVLKELEERGWRTKRWTTRKGNERGGRPFDKAALYKVLTNVTYLGKVRYKQEVHEGVHEAIVPADLWERVQKELQRNGRTGGAHVRNKYSALLKGLLHCTACGRAMTHTTTAKRNKVYRYYTCTGAQKRGWHSCPSKSVPAEEIERFVVDQIRCIGSDPELVAETLRETDRQAREQIEQLESERARVERQLRRDHGDVRKLSANAAPSEQEASRLADLQDRVGSAERRLTEIADEIGRLRDGMVEEDEAKRALAEFDPVWEQLSPREQCDLLQLLIEGVEYDGGGGTLSITFHPTGIGALAEQMADTPEEAAA